MSDRTILQAYRQPFGYYMEELVADYFRQQEKLVLSHDRNHFDYNKSDNNKIKESLSILFGRLSKVSLCSEYFLQKLDEKSNISGLEYLIGSNTIEMFRFEGYKPIISEVKSQYGVNDLDYRIEFNKGQISLLRELDDVGVESSLIYCIALPYARFIEIPFKDIRSALEKSNRIRIPISYRSKNLYTSLTNANYTDKDTLISAIKLKYPNLKRDF